MIATSADLSTTVRSFLAAGTLPLSRSVSRVQTMLQSADYNAADLAEHMRTDPTLTARVMSVANSSFFSQQPCDAISDAVNRLGSAQLTRIFAQVLARAALMSPQHAYGLTADAIWRRAVYSAVGAEMASARQREDRSSAYMIGLLHQIGMLVINSLWSKQPYAKKLTLANFELEYSAEEKLRYDFDQAELGAEMLRQLSFPESVHRVIGQQYRTPLEPLSRALYIGRLARAVHCDNLTPRPDLEVLELFDLASKKQLDGFLAEINTEVQNRLQGGG